MRNKPWAAPELDACPFFIRNPSRCRNRWHGLFPRKQPIHLELGCGKGVFLAELAPKNPEINYLGIDLKDSVLGPAKRNIEQAFHDCRREPDNVLLTAQNIEQISDILGPDDLVDRIYINFCNPWPRAKHHKRRLTHPRQLEKYKLFLQKGGEIRFKTDDDPLFEDTAVYLEECGFEIVCRTGDLLAQPDPEDATTEHEKMFAAQGVKIKALTAKLR